jgi:hypothetical protein
MHALSAKRLPFDLPLHLPVDLQTGSSCLPHHSTSALAYGPQI